MSPRVHEAEAVPCGRCGAPLVLDVTSPWVWCRVCHAWQAVPEEVRRAAWERWNALERARAAQDHERTLAAQRERMLETERTKSRVLSAVVAGGILVFVLPTLGTVALYAVATVLVAFDELELWAAVPLVALLVAAALGFFLAGLGACFFLYRRATRHRRWSRIGGDAEWYGAARQSGSAVLVGCGECGAPLAFRPGEHSVQCGHCRAVVLEPEEHAGSVMTMALSEVQLARRARARPERALLRARIATQRRTIALRAWFMAGSMAFIAIPALAFGYAVRAITPSLEELMLELGKRLSGEFGAGLDPPFEWLDLFWIGDTPPSFDMWSTFASRWSIASTFRGRPVLVSVLASWSDLRAKRAALVLACPRQRNAARVMASQTAQRMHTSGWAVHVDYAGIALVSADVPQKSMTVESLTALVVAAYELAEEVESPAR